MIYRDIHILYVYTNGYATSIQVMLLFFEKRLVKGPKPNDRQVFPRIGLWKLDSQPPVLHQRDLVQHDVCLLRVAPVLHG